MLTPTLLDLCCGAGGATIGYMRAGFDVTGVDLHPHPRYPAPQIRADVIDVLETLARYPWTRRGYHAIHVSPPCQADCTLTIGTNADRGDHTSYTARCLELLEDIGLPYICEQPDGRAPLRKDLRLCGEMFDLGVLRHRNFQLGTLTIPQPTHKSHRGPVRGWRHGVYRDGPYVAAYGNGGGKATIAEMQDAMDIDWVEDRRGLTEAIPPAYTAYIGTHLMGQL